MNKHLMAKLPQESINFVLLVFFAVSVLQTKARLHSGYYDETCPEAEKIIAKAVVHATMHDTKVPARIVRLFFHDCFITGCDASILLDTTDKEKAAEKDSPPNESVRAYYVIDDAKAELEEVCPQTVSCADIIAIAARDAVHLTGGPYWKVLKGRKDGRRSSAQDSFELPKPSLNVSTLIDIFSKRGLNIKDIVALTGSHSIGTAHCASFEPRIHRYSHKDDVDPSLDSELADRLQKRCLNHDKDPDAGHHLDSTSKVFDNDYFKRLLVGKGILKSDQAMYIDHRTKFLVESYAEDEELFFADFATSMVKFGNYVGKGEGEIRRDCRYVN